MAIQFRCTGCGQPIEVDDEFADRMVGCPFCKTTVQAPATGRLDAPNTNDEGLASVASHAPPGFAADPTQHAPGSAPAMLPAQPAAARFCTYGLLCGVGLWSVQVLIGFVILSQTGSFGRLVEAQQHQDDPEVFQAAVAEIVNDAMTEWPKTHAGTAVLLFLLTVALMLGGIATSVAGLLRSPTRKGRAVLGLLMCSICATMTLISIVGSCTAAGGG